MDALIYTQTLNFSGQSDLQKCKRGTSYFRQWIQVLDSMSLSTLPPETLLGKFENRIILQILHFAKMNLNHSFTLDASGCFLVRNWSMDFNITKYNYV